MLHVCEENEMLLNEILSSKRKCVPVFHSPSNVCINQLYFIACIFKSGKS